MQAAGGASTGGSCTSTSDGRADGGSDGGADTALRPPPSVHLTVSAGLHMTWHDFLHEAVRGTLARMAGDVGEDGDAGAEGSGDGAHGDEDKDEDGIAGDDEDQELAVAMRRTLPADFLRCTGVIWQEDEDEEEEE